jgi:hypothetical protein
LCGREIKLVALRQDHELDHLQRSFRDVNRRKPRLLVSIGPRDDRVIVLQVIVHRQGETNLRHCVKIPGNLFLIAVYNRNQNLFLVVVWLPCSIEHFDVGIGCGGRGRGHTRSPLS